MPGTRSASVSDPLPLMPMFEGSQQLSPGVDTIESCTTSELPTLLQGCSPHCIKLIAGIDARTLRDLFKTNFDVSDQLPVRPIVFLDLQGLYRTETMIDRAIGQLAGMAADLWPLWFGADDFCELNDDALGHMYLPIKLASISSRCPGISSGWAEAAIRQVLRTHSPR